MKVLFLHGWQSVPGGVKPTYFATHGHTVINPKLPDEDFAESIRVAQTEFDHHRPDVVIPFADSEELAGNSGAQLVEIGRDHRLADPEPLAAMLKACETQH